MFSGVRNFAITFCISLIIFGLLAYFIMGFITEAVGLKPPADTTDDVAIETQQPSDVTTSDNETEPGPDDEPKVNGSSFNLLLIGTDYQPDKLVYGYHEEILDEDGFPMDARVACADTVIFIRVDKEREEFIVSALPSNTRLLDHGVYTTLASLYGTYGTEYFVEKAAFLFGFPIDDYLVVSIPALEQMIDGLDGISFYVPQDMSYTDTKEGLVIDLKKGTQKLNGADALAMLRFDQYTTGGSRLDTGLSFLKELLYKCTDPSYYSRVPELFATYSSLFETNITQEDLAQKLDLLFAYPDFGQTIVTYPGSSAVYDGKTYFQPNLTKARAAMAVYK